MIIDSINNHSLYEPLSPRIKKSFEFLLETDLKALEMGRYEIDGKDIFAMVDLYPTKSIEQGRWEAHRRYIDLQYVVRGRERVGFGLLHLFEQGEYDAEKDYVSLSGSGDFVTLREGGFVLLFPDDAHMSGIMVEGTSVVKKVVIKIAVN